MLSGICHVSLNSQKYPLSPSPFLFPSCSCSTQSSGFPKILKNDSFVFRRGIGVCTIYVSTELNPPWCHLRSSDQRIPFWWHLHLGYDSFTLGRPLASFRLAISSLWFLLSYYVLVNALFFMTDRGAIQVLNNVLIVLCAQITIKGKSILVF